MHDAVWWVVPEHSGIRRACIRSLSIHWHGRSRLWHTHYRCTGSGGGGVKNGRWRTASARKRTIYYHMETRVALGLESERDVIGVGGR